MCYNLCRLRWCPLPAQLSPSSRDNSRNSPQKNGRPASSLDPDLQKPSHNCEIPSLEAKNGQPASSLDPDLQEPSHNCEIPSLESTLVGSIGNSEDAESLPRVEANADATGYLSQECLSDPQESTMLAGRVNKNTN